MDMDRLFSLDGKVALVTGGASSLGGSAAGVSSHATVPPLRSAFRSAPRSRFRWRSPSAASGVRRLLMIWLAGAAA